MVEKRQALFPIDASFDDVGKVVDGAKLTSPPARQTIAGSFDSQLRISGTEIDCYLLEDESWILSQRSLLQGLGIMGGDPRNEKELPDTGAELPGLASQKWLQPCIDRELEMALKRLTLDCGQPKQREHIEGGVALMRTSFSWVGFIRVLDRAYFKFGDTIQFSLNQVELFGV
jgi:hypothetical protein